jgi:hypothetical protein
MRLTRTIPALPVEHIRESVMFYTEKFGFSAGYYDAGFAKLFRDEVEIHLWASSDGSWKVRPGFTHHPVVSGAETFLAGTASCRVEVEGIDELFSEYSEKGIIYNPETVIVSQPWGTREFPILDHHRNLLTFFERL